MISEDDDKAALQLDEDISESEKEHLQKHYDLLWSSSDKNVLPSQSTPIPITNNYNYNRDSASVNFLVEFDLLPIIEESTKKTKNFMSIITKQLKEQQVYSNGRSPSISINQYSFARSRLNSQKQKLVNLGSAKGNAIFSPKDISSSRSCSPRKDFQDSSSGYGYSCNSSYIAGQCSNIYTGGNAGAVGGEVKQRDPLLPVLGNAAFNRQNKLHSGQQNHYVSSRSTRSKGFRSPIKSSDFPLLYGTSSTGLESVLNNKTNYTSKPATTSEKLSLSIPDHSDSTSTKNLWSPIMPISPVIQTIQSPGNVAAHTRQLAPLAPRHLSVSEFNNSYLADDRNSKRPHYHLVGCKQ